MNNRSNSIYWAVLLTGLVMFGLAIRNYWELSNNAEAQRIQRAIENLENQP